MEQQQTPAFAFVSPFAHPPYYNEERSRPPWLQNETPARVNVAMSFLMNLTFKTMTRAAVNDISIQLIPGEKLTKEESIAQANACHMLSDYFTGNMNPDIWEEQFLKNAMPKKPINPKELDPRAAGVIVPCPACLNQSGRIQADCNLCGGSGHLITVPVNGKRNK